MDATSGASMILNGILKVACGQLWSTFKARLARDRFLLFVASLHIGYWQLGIYTLSELPIFLAGAVCKRLKSVPEKLCPC